MQFFGWILPILCTQLVYSELVFRTRSHLPFDLIIFYHFRETIVCLAWPISENKQKNPLNVRILVQCIQAFLLKSKPKIEFTWILEVLGTLKN